MFHLFLLTKGGNRAKSMLGMLPNELLCFNKLENSSAIKHGGIFTKIHGSLTVYKVVNLLK